WRRTAGKASRARAAAPRSGGSRSRTGPRSSALAVSPVPGRAGHPADVTTVARSGAAASRERWGPVRRVRAGEESGPPEELSPVRGAVRVPSEPHSDRLRLAVQDVVTVPLAPHPGGDHLRRGAVTHGDVL